MSRDKGEPSFLPTSLPEARARGWDELDVVLISGDAYVDHPSFAAAVIGRVLESRGFRVGIIPQPDWRSAAAFASLGRPRLFFGVTAGNVDSMLSRFTVNRKRRSSDPYSPGGAKDRRPKRATIVYANRAREAFKDVPVVIGGIEASLRRLAHYDFWDDAVRRSILLDSKADLLVYGMGEQQVIEIARRLDAGQAISDLRDIRGTVYVTADQPEAVALPSFEEASSDPAKFAEAFRLYERQCDPFFGEPACQQHGDRYVVALPPPASLSTAEIDGVYDLPFTRRWHPRYDTEGGVPALETVRFSVISHRGCVGNCAFCALGFHQGKVIQSRSKQSILREAARIARDPLFKGTIADVGGPTANMYRMKCQRSEHGCRERTCLTSKICKQLDTDHAPLIDVLRALRDVSGVRHVFTGSGIRYDLALADTSGRYLDELCAHHVSGQLKVAPEHVSDAVLRVMSKPPAEEFERFRRRFAEINCRLRKKQYLVPYFMSSHPGCRLKDMIALAEYLRDSGQYVEQVQDFYPSPMTLATCIYHTGIHPHTGKPLYVAKTEAEKATQRALLQYRDARNGRRVREALLKEGRRDLIGRGGKCLIR